MLLEKELCDFSSEMYLDLIMKFNNDIEFEETNKFSEEEDLRTLDVDQLKNRLEKSLSVSIDKVEKMLDRNLETSDIVRLCHIGIEIANAKCGQSKKSLSSTESEDSSPNETQSDENTAKTPIQSSIPIDLERRIREMEYSSHTGPPAEIDDNTKRWLVVGICLHSVLAAALRKYVEPVITNLYNSLKLSDQIDKQTYTGHLKIYGAVNFYLNYKTINNNKTPPGNRAPNYDYKVQNAVDLSKLFLETSMAHYKGFDESCDSSALFGIIVNTDKFPANVQIAAKDIRLEIRNRWAHCDFTEWNSGLYNWSLQKIEDFIYLLHLNKLEESQAIRDLNKWKTNGINYLEDTTLGLELVNDIRREITSIMEVEKIICKSADREFSTVHTKLTEIGNTLNKHDKRISSLENKVALQDATLLKYKSLYDAEPVINSWKQKMEFFVETNVVIDILEILKDSHCALLIGVSGMGKTLTAQNVALRLWHEKEYSIVPCCSLNDIQTRYRENVNQVFFMDDICGRYTTNIMKIENWMNIEEFVKCILGKGKTKILATCRTEVFLEEIFQDTFEIFSKTTYNLSEKYSFKDKLVIAENYLKQDEEMLSATIRSVEFNPLMCFLYAQHEHFDINDFLNCPYEMFCKEWNKLKSFDKEKYCVLFLCVLYNGTIDESLVDFSKELDKNEKRKLKDIFECCNLGRDTSRVAIRDKLNACIDTYVIKVDKEYKVIHDKMFDFLCCYFGKILIAPILKYAHDTVICERVQLESLQEAHRYFTIIVSEDDEEKYNKRIKMDLENGKIHCCLNNAQMKYKEYRIKFRDIIRNLENNLMTNLINSKDDNGINSFIVSCLRGYEEIVAFFISVGADVDCQNGFFTPLTAACHDGHFHTVEILLHKGSNINQTNTHGETPLYTACFEGHYILVNLLIDKEADINKKNKYNHTPLYASCLTGHEIIVSLLIDNEANVSQDCLIVASLGGHKQIIEKLLLSGCGINSVDTKGKTALFIACEEGYTNIVKLLIDNNADIYKVDGEGRTPLHAACYFGNNDIVSILISNDLDVNMLDVDFETPLHKACRNGSIRVIQTLLNYGADVHKLNKEGHTPIYLANTEGNIVDECILKALQKKEITPTKGENITKGHNNEFHKQTAVLTNNLIRYGWTPLYEACVYGDIKTVQSLIQNRADVNMKTDSGEMPLVAACQQGHGFLIQMLLEEGADIYQALVCAVLKDCDRAVKILLHKGGDLNYKSVDGKSLIKLACEYGSIKAIKILSDKGADFTEINVNGRTLIHVACNTNSVELLQFLIDKGLDLSIPDKNGRFALFLSIDKGFYDLSKYLVQKRCPITISEKDTKTALISVFESGNKEMSKLLVSNGYTDNLLQFEETMLYHAHKLGLYEKDEIIRRYGTDTKKRYKYGYTPMILADIGGNDDLHNQTCSSYLSRSTSHGIKGKTYTSDKKDNDTFKFDPFFEESEDETSNICFFGENKDIFQACMYGQTTSLIRGMLFDVFFNPIDPYVSIWFEQTPLLLAIRRGHTEVSKFLIRHGANVNLTFEERRMKNDISLSTTIVYGYTPLFAAYQRKDYEIVHMLLNKGANLNKALYDACREGYLNTVQFLLRKGANVNLICRFGQTALYAACIGGHSTIVKFLVDRGAFVDVKVSRASIFDEPTYLHAAYLSDNHDIVKYLINRGASVDTVGNFGRTLLHKACSDGNYKLVEMLVDKGFDINTSDVYGSTPLIACVLQNIENNHQIQYFYRFMERSYSIGNCDQYHEFHHLYERFPQCEKEYEHPSENHYKIIQLLIENGADIKKADKKGRTPLNLALKIGVLKLTVLLLNKMINENN
ncbi:uncharacterized protein LOC143054167 [Mytilus galloprovincialis]|uniref:uncharacterized protein LOC143054167 n=1 Tax=Mytilus galloprovincialis TaxID=29158 RepID=UPI003F7C4C49